MVHKIKQIKDQALKRMEDEINERGIERADVKQLGELADIVKDLAEAEKACWEAEYYSSVTEAMGNGQGYMPDGGSMGGYGNMGGSMGSASRQGYRDSRGRYARRSGYSMGYDDDIQSLRDEMRNASPEEREKMQRELRQLLNM